MRTSLPRVPPPAIRILEIISHCLDTLYDRMCVALILALCLLPICAYDDPRLSMAGFGQNVAEMLVSEVWGRVAGTEFAGGTAAVYTNQKEGQTVVNTEGGAVRGLLTTTSRDGTPYAAYMGIPYAKPPVGTLRFQAPLEPEPWEGILDGRKEQHTCIGFREPTKGREDCLYLNVFTPSLANNDSLPVMVFVYGGAFIGGSSNTSGYAPDFLVDKGVVLVTFNYRIGPLGFLSLQTEKLPGNAGLKDQSLALRWVQKNIRAFGGDPYKVTIFGESAGAASVGYHLLSPMSQEVRSESPLDCRPGLFHRAVMESGSPLADWAYIEPSLALARAFSLGNKVGCVLPILPERQIDHLHQCLLDAPAALLAKAQFIGLTIKDLVGVRPLAFVPTMEPPEASNSFLTKSPQECFSSGDFNNVPVWMGMNTAEGLLIYKGIKKIDPTGALVAYLSKNLPTLAPAELASESKYTTALQQKMETFYTGTSGVANTATLLQLLKLIGDTQFLIPLLKTAGYLTTYSQHPVYNYLFAFDGAYACYKINEGITDLPGTCHADELGYLFIIGPIEKIYNHKDRSNPAEKVIDLMTTTWTHFAATGKPTAENECRAFRKTETNYCEISQTLTPKTSIMSKSVKFWNDVYEMVQGKRPIPQ